MPIYTFACDTCPSQFEVFQKMTDNRPTSCPTCQGNIYRIYDIVGVTVDTTIPKTIGEIAHKNTERMVGEGKLDKKALEYESTNKKKTEAFVKKQKLASMTNDQKMKYIFEGKM
jgi:putative FmdB family regulatory protein